MSIITGFINHRINTVRELARAHPSNGAEFDLREFGTEFRMVHNPFELKATDENFETYAKAIASRNNQSPWIVNSKGEGFDKKAAAILSQNGVRNWFFLDGSAAFTCIYNNDPGMLLGDAWGRDITADNLSVRFSLYEGMETVRRASTLTPKNAPNTDPTKGPIGARWCWVDYFENVLPVEHFTELQDLAFKICIVSPELQGKSLSLIPDFLNRMANVKAHDITVCTKRPDLWGQPTTPDLKALLEASFPEHDTVRGH